MNKNKIINCLIKVAKEVSLAILWMFVTLVMFSGVLLMEGDFGKEYKALGVIIWVVVISVLAYKYRKELKEIIKESLDIHRD